MWASTGRLSLASDIQSVARLGGGRTPTKSEAPAATLVAVPVCEAGTRGLTTPHTRAANEGVDMTKRTRGYPGSDSGTRDTGVKITPPTHSDPVTTTPTVA